MIIIQWDVEMMLDEFFRSHEWIKHGTCAKAGHAVASQYEYFKLALDLQQKLNILQYVYVETLD